MQSLSLGMGLLDEMSPAGDHRTIWEEQCRTSGLSRAFSDGNREGAARGNSNPIDEIAPTSVVKIGAGYKARLAKKQAKLAETLDQATIVLDLVGDN